MSSVSAGYDGGVQQQQQQQTASVDTWRSQFQSKINILPKPKGDCAVCFYEQPNFVGSSFCVGKREQSCTKVNPITAPGTIGSIKFGKGCNLVANVRVTDAPYDSHVDVLSTDVANTGYNLTSDHSVQEVYVEEAGRACFLGTPESGNGYGLCYTKSVPIVDDQYRNALTELMLFKSDAKDFDVIAYENDYYNSPEKSVVQRAVSESNKPGLSQRFTGYSKTLDTSATDSSTGMKKTLTNKVRSIEFVEPEEDSTPGSVHSPAQYAV
ncbi:hypothetical protein PHYSODRAFT_339745 [Phytophthora sojae]|uniref:Uncharacterized protein n=1 Tax=Phytophthora sojae (strain P6497) TaxID=1094619 RepID=G5A7G2_PHYSP|nr:hypothetical protein PHYSODRAFT_339745 [Phytophthora sojae]EGZ07841.1 hypothetical protein PHYSODRAFT_339745 [Phytophthora sojae]|eukprot:XP_009536013.1 hypothetical protein PHYSODRAFT_339745 [Phytophthora sojae]